MESKEAYSTINGESYKHVTHGNAACTVVFSAFAARDYGPDSFSFLKNFLPCIDCSDLLFIKDTKNQWYNRDLPGIGGSPTEVVEWLGRTLAPYSRVTFFGSSMGAYASLLYGSRLGVGHIVAVSPQTFLRSPFPRFSPRIHKGGYADLKHENFAKVGRVDLVVGEEDLFDLYQLNTIENAPNIIKTTVPEAFHNVLYLWNLERRFDGFVRAVAANESAALIDEWREAMLDRSVVAHRLGDEEYRLGLAQAVELRYNGDLRGAMRTLRQIMPSQGDWLGALAMMGLAKLESGALLDGIEILLEIRRRNATIDDIYRPLARALASIGRFDEAMAVARDGTKLNEANKLGLDEIDAIMESYEIDRDLLPSHAEGVLL